jgi:calcium-dependent protein kinase
MGSFQNFVCAECLKKEDEENQDGNYRIKESYFIPDIVNTVPKNVTDIKVDTRNFITKSEKNVFDIYEKICELGNGAFGTVYKVKRKNSGFNPIIRALKEISKEKMQNNEESGLELKNEIEILKNIDHPNIMKIFEFFEDDNNIYLINEFCGGGDVASLHDKYGEFPEFLLKFVMSQVFLAISFLHSNKVVHGDIKRENIAFVYDGKYKTKEEFERFFSKIFKDKEIQNEINEVGGMDNLSEEAQNIVKELCNYEIKILDFGSAKMKKRDKINKKLTGIVGTAYYCSPEVVKEKYDFESDEWACGVMMYILLSNVAPFPGDNEEEIFDNILSKEINVDIPELKSISNNCKDLIKKLCNKNPKQRIKSEEALNHPFFKTGINFSNLLKGVYVENTKELKKIFRNKNSNLFGKKFTNSKFKEMVIAYIGLNFPDKVEAQKARKIFLEISGGNKHFLITKETFVSRFEKAFKNLTKEEIENLFDSLDQNETGNIEYEELIRALSDRDKLLSNKNLGEAFKFFDKDNNGFITWNEIAEIIYPEGKIPENIMKEFLEEIGQKDENVKIDFYDFKRILTK